MKLSIQTKLLVFCIALFLVTTAGIAATYSVLTRQDKQRESQQRIQIGFDIILNDLTKRITTYTASMHKFLQENVTLLWGTYTYSLDDTEAGTIRFLFDHFPDVAEELRQFGRVALADRVSLYGANKRLLVVYQRTDDKEGWGGYLESEEEGSVYLPMDDLSVQAEITFRRNNLSIDAKNRLFPATPLPTGVDAYYKGDIPAATSVVLFGQRHQLGIRIIAPIYRRDTIMAILVGEVFFTQQMVEEYASLSKTDINFFSGNHLSIGTFREQTSLPSHTFDQTVHWQELLNNRPPVNVTSATFGQQDYYQGYCAFRNNQGLLGAITVNLSKEIEQREIQKIVKAVFTISGVGIIICFVLVSGLLVPKFTGPIITLTHAALRMAQGDLTQRIDTSGTDELGTLARSFTHMRDEIQSQIEELQQLNAELDHRVEERTAEVVRQKYILDTFLETVPDRIYFKDLRGRITQANMAHARRMGLEHPSDEIGKSDFDFFPRQEAQSKYEQELQIIQTGQPLIGVEEKQSWPDGHEEWALVTKMPLRDEHGEIIGTFGISRNITDLKHTEDALRHAKNAAESANRAKSEFLANMSHELRTPLNVILGLVQIMVRNPHITSEERENLDIIRHSGEHLLTLINNVLDVSKIEAEQVTVNESNIDLFRFLDELEEMFSLKASQKRIHLVFERSNDVPRYIRLDVGKLRQILINLLNNAVKFTDEGGVSLRITPETPVQQQSSHGTALHFEVEDTGPGIVPDEMPRLFEAFGQTRTGRQTREGTGLGLTISQKFVQLLGGEISVHSELGRGTTFAFTLPVSVVPQSEVLPPSTRNRVIALEPGQPRYRLLIVDDNPENRRLLLKLFTPFGFELCEASNGQDAIALWATFAPHLIWMDIRMPGMDGYETTRRIRKAENEALSRHEASGRTCIIALTASSFDDERGAVLSAGCDDFLRKPFRETEIFDMLHQHLGIRFVYEQEQPRDVLSARAVREEIVTPAALRALPSDLFAQLRQAVDVTDPEMVVQLLPRIRAQNPILAEALNELIKEFRFDILQTLFEEMSS